MENKLESHFYAPTFSQKFYSKSKLICQNIFNNVSFLKGDFRSGSFFLK